jgi:hypothetical protein
MSQANSAHTTLPAAAVPTGGGSSRRALLTVAAAVAGGTLANAVAIGMTKAGQVDPIFGLIEKHVAACDAAREISDAWGDMHPHDQQYAATERDYSRVHQARKDALVELLSCQPTSLTGVIAVLAHVGQQDWAYGDDSEETILLDGYESGIEEAKSILTHLGTTLRNIIERGRA